MKMYQNKILIALCFSLILFSCSEDTSTESQTSSATSTTTYNSDTTIINQSDTTIVQAQKTKTDEYMEVGEEAINLTKEIINNKRSKDSLRNSNKKRMWVYQINSAYDDESVIGADIEKLKSVKNIYVFKKGKNEFYLIKDDGISTEEQLREEYGDVKKEIQAIAPYRIELIDLSIQCSPKTQPTVTSPLKYKIKKERKEVECRICS